MPGVTIQYFTGCRHWQLADQRVRRAARGRDDIRIDHQLVETAEEAQRLGFAGSPTILVDGFDPFAEPDQPIGLSCRVYRTPEGGVAGAPTMDQLTDALAAHEHG
jgi:hypothetical protein